MLKGALVHEFAHGMHLCGLNNTTFNNDLNVVYNTALMNDLWTGTYAATNSREYWAEVAQSYLGVNTETPDESHNGINGEEELLEYDPDGYYFADQIFGQ